MIKYLKDYFKLTKKQKENQLLVLKELFMLVGALVLSQGIILLLPSNGKFLIGIGLVLFVLGIALKKIR